jgi:hypothetical protein
LKPRRILKRPSITRARLLPTLWNRSNGHLRKLRNGQRAPRTLLGSRRSINTQTGSHICTSCG